MAKVFSPLYESSPQRIINKIVSFENLPGGGKKRVAEGNGTTSVHRDEYCRVGSGAESTTPYKSHVLNTNNIVRRSFVDFISAVANQAIP